eukprot:UN01645
MQKLGKKQLVVDLREPVENLPAELDDFPLELSADGCQVTYTYDIQAQRTGITDLLQALRAAGFNMRDINTSQSSLEEIFVNLVHTNE